MGTINEISRRSVSPFLDPDEELVWAAQPLQGLRFVAADWFIVPFSALWAGFATFMFVGVVWAGGGVFAIFGVPFVLIGLYITIGRFFVSARRRVHIHYAITNRRVIRVSGKNAQRLQTKELTSISELDLSVRSDGSGSIGFGGDTTDRRTSALQESGWTSTGSDQLRIALIPNAREVHEQLRQARKLSRNAEGSAS